MALDPIITADQTDPKSPIDQELMDGVRLNLENFDSRLTLSAGADFDFRVNGPLDLLNLGTNPNGGKELDGAFIAQERTLQVASFFLDKQGQGGTLELNVRRLKFLGHPISGIKNIFTANTESINRGSATLDTQSITKAEADLATQSVTYAKAAINILNITQVTGSALFRINLDDINTPLDEDYQLGKYITISGADAGNNGTFEIREVNKDNGKNIIVEIATGVVQPTAGGAIQLHLVAYTFLSTVPDNFSKGEDFVAVGHTDVSNDGTFSIYKKNQGGNNILIYRDVELVEQVGAGGQAEVLRYQYNFTSPVLGAFVEGEVAEFSLHTDPANDGSFEMKQINNGGGNNIVVYNPAGVTQGGVAGAVDTNRWVYALDSDPDGFFQVEDNAIMVGHDDPANNGTFPVVDVKYLATNNVVVYNAAGVVQAAANGTVDHAQKAITFRQDYSASFIADKSSIEIKNTFNGVNDGTFKVLDINRLAVSPFNIVCELTSGVLQESDDGQIFSENRSIFTNESVSFEIDQDKQVKTITNPEGAIVDEPLAENTILLLDILQAPLNSATVAVNIK